MLEVLYYLFAMFGISVVFTSMFIPLLLLPNGELSYQICGRSPHASVKPTALAFGSCHLEKIKERNRRSPPWNQSIVPTLSKRSITKCFLMKITAVFLIAMYSVLVHFLSGGAISRFLFIIGFVTSATLMLLGILAIYFSKDQP